MQDGMDRPQERHRMVVKQLIPRGITSPLVLAAMEAVPRHSFVPQPLTGMAYSDGPLPIGEGQTISQPYIVALMIETAQIHTKAKVLEIGTGSGYSAAVLAHMGATVYTIERLPALSARAKETLDHLGYRQVSCIVADGTLGWPSEAPYDAIIVTAGAPAVPDTLRNQLAIGGVLVIPVGDAIVQHLLRIERLGPEDYREQAIEAVRFVPLIGQEGW